MKELSFYFFQCVNLRILANSTEIELYVVEHYDANTLELIIKDNGLKFDIRLLEDDVFLKKSWPALHFLKMDCNKNGGDFKMLWHNLSGNLISLHYPLLNCPRISFGNGGSLLSMLFVTHPYIHFVFSQISQKGEFIFDSEQFKSRIGEINFESDEFLSNLKALLLNETTAIRAFA